MNTLIHTARHNLSRLNPFQFSLSKYKVTLFVIGTVILLSVVLVKSRTANEFLTDPFLLWYTLFVTSFQLSRLVSASFFKRSHRYLLESIPQKELEAYEPTISFVIPCYNEEEVVERTIEKCLEAEYPDEKIEVIAVNDGSTDNTGAILERVARKHPRVTAIQFEENRGKRHGMAAGFKEATGEIVVQLDSDSYMDPKTFRKLIEPFANPKIGAVCAHADPENVDKNWLTKMQAAYYFMSFRILKAAESSYGVVFCCSGCSSAYRREVVDPIIDEWVNETFLGRPVTWGDDRGLTNWVLKRDYKTIYTDEARAYTIVPETLMQFIKQQVRWKKGWFVNSLFALTFIIKKEPFVSFTYFIPLTLVTLLTPFMAIRALIYIPFSGTGASAVFYALGVTLIAVLIVIFYRWVSRENKYWPYLFVWSGINMVILSFLLFYALATIQDRGWNTR